MQVGDIVNWRHYGYPNMPDCPVEILGTESTGRYPVDIVILQNTACGSGVTASAWREGDRFNVMWTELSEIRPSIATIIRRVT